MRLRTGGAALCVAVAVMVEGAGVATAKPPDTSPPTTDTSVFDVPSELSCGDFGVSVSQVDGKAHDIYFADWRAFLHSPGARYRVDADNSDRFVVVNGSGGFHDSPPVDLDPPADYDGVTYELAIPTKMTGHNLLAGLFIDANGEATPGVYAMRGKATATFLLDFDGFFAFADLKGGTRTDLCAVLR